MDMYKGYRIAALTTRDYVVYRHNELVMPKEKRFFRTLSEAKAYVDTLV